MHMKGSPQTMQARPYYGDLLNEIADYFKDAVKKAIQAGVKKENIIIDPGIGFGKSLKHNLIIMKNIPYFKKMGFPVMIGASRKSFLGKLTGLEAGQRLIPTAAANAIAVYSGADIIRVHDAGEAMLVSKVACAIKNI
jgi:dihydropteroate synthase